MKVVTDRSDRVNGEGNWEFLEEGFSRDSLDRI